MTNEEIERETKRLLDESNRFLSGLYKAKEQTKMTREEALKIQATCYTTVQLLEALGLLKFDEVKKDSKYRKLLNTCVWAANNVLCTESHVATCVKEAIEEYYKKDEQSVDKLEMVEWHCEGIVHRYPKGYDPNHNSGLVWIKVADTEDNKPSPSMVIRSKLIDLVNQPMQCADGILNALYKAGYTISNQKGELKLSKSIYSCGITEGNLKALNASGYEIVYTGVTTSSSTEFLTISVGTHTHEVALQTIVKALNAKGCTVYRNRVEL